MKKQLPGWAVLLIITLVAGLALGATYALTKEPIAQQALAQAENARKAALPEADAFQQLTLAEDAPVDWAYAGLKTAEDGSTATIGHVSQITVKGYKGPVEVTVGLDNDLTLTGISVGGSDFAETAGLGAKAKEPAFQEQFAGKKTPVSVIKQGGTPGDNTVDAITAATITSNAVRDAVNSVAKFIRQDVMGAAEIEMPARPEDGQVFSAKEKGFAGPVYVEAAFDGDGKITYIAIGDEEFSETPGFGAAALEKENQFPFIGSQMPLALEDVDALTGATFTKTAVVNGLNIAYDASRGSVTEPEAPAAEIEPEVPAAEIEMPARPEDGQVFSAKEKGFAGPVYVEAAFDGDGKITYIAIGDEEFSETPGYGAAALEKENQFPFIGAQMPLALEDVDALTGATFTKTAVVNGLNIAYDASRGSVTEPEAPAAEIEPEAPVTEIEMPARPEDGQVFSAKEKGFAGPVYVEAAFDGDGKITYIAIGDEEFSETPGFGAAALEKENQFPFIGAQMPLALEDIDALTGATFTKTAIVNGLNIAYDASQGSVTEPEAPAAEIEPEAPVTEIEMPARPEDGQVFSAKEKGFAGPVYVEAAFDGDGKITYIAIGDEEFSETPGYGAAALEKENQFPFIGAQMPLALEDVDALTGATFTKTAVINGLNEAYAQSLAGQQ